jgi:hypothetical protein
METESIEEKTQYLPMSSFSSSSEEPGMATSTSMKGLKTETNNRPLITLACFHNQ